jgi:hypothetical protein
MYKLQATKLMKVLVKKAVVNVPPEDIGVLLTKMTPSELIWCFQSYNKQAYISTPTEWHKKSTIIMQQLHNLVWDRGVPIIKKDNTHDKK